MFISQLFLQFILLLYSDFFCRSAIKIIWRCPRTTTYRQCVFSFCDWLLVFCFFVSWCSSIIIIAPVFQTFHRLSIYPSIHDLRISSITNPYFLQSKSTLYFHPSVHVNMSSAAATFILTSAIPAYDATIQYDTATFATTQLHYQHKEKKSPLIDDISLNVQNPFQTKNNYAHRLWPNIWLGSIHNATAGAVLLIDSWVYRLEDHFIGKKTTNKPNVSWLPNQFRIIRPNSSLGLECL